MPIFGVVIKVMVMLYNLWSFFGEGEGERVREERTTGYLLSPFFILLIDLINGWFGSFTLNPMI